MCSLPAAPIGWFSLAPMAILPMRPIFCTTSSTPSGRRLPDIPAWTQSACAFGKRNATRRSTNVRSSTSRISWTSWGACPRSWGRSRAGKFRGYISAEQVPSRFVLEFVWRGLRFDEDIGSGSEVNRLVSRSIYQGLPSVDFAHRNLTSGEQRREQHGRGLGRGQHRLGLDPAFELLVEPFNRVGGSRTLPLADG